MIETGNLVDNESNIFFPDHALYVVHNTGNSQKDRRLGGRRQKKAENSDGIVTYLSFFLRKRDYRLTGSHTNVDS